MKTQYDENLLVYWILPNEKYFVKMKKGDGLYDDDCDMKDNLPALLGAFILSNGKRFMNIFRREINGFYINSLYYGDRNSMYIEKKLGGVG